MEHVHMEFGAMQGADKDRIFLVAAMNVLKDTLS
jgi:hypothetical protein